MNCITTIVPCFNQESYIDSAICSAIEQLGDFSHEILASSDGSQDKTRAKIREWQKRYPLLVRDLSEELNVGISSNFRRLFDAASGEYIAILEGDDLWTDPQKLERQMAFLQSNPDCSMVFSMIQIRQLPSGKEFVLERQTGLDKEKLHGEDFLADPSMNLIANFSSCMFRTSLVRKLPNLLFRKRLNEIALAFYFELFGPIGFIKDVMSIYHMHPGGVWSGLTREAQLRSAMEAREIVLEVAHKRHSDAIRRIIEESYRKPIKALKTREAES